MLGRGDTLLGNPRHYRDHSNDGTLDYAFSLVPRDQIFRRTGIQFLQFNSLFQLLALKRQESPLLDKAETLLMMPDRLNFWFTGEKRTECSIGTNTQMYDPKNRDWATDLVEPFSLPARLL